VGRSKGLLNESSITLSAGRNPLSEKTDFLVRIVFSSPPYKRVIFPFPFKNRGDLDSCTANGCCALTIDTACPSNKRNKSLLIKSMGIRLILLPNKAR
jgi:hypothetical protein